MCRHAHGARVLKSPQDNDETLTQCGRLRRAVTLQGEQALTCSGAEGMREIWIADGKA
jgi:hypothetical protein